MLNLTVNFSDKFDRNCVIARYTFLNGLLTLYMEKSEMRLKFERKRTFLVLWVNLFSSSFSSNLFGGKDRYTPITDRQDLLTGQNCPDQTGHDDFKVPEGKSPRFFIFVSGPEVTSLLDFFGIKHERGLYDEHEEESSGAASDGRSGNTSFFCVRCLWVFIACAIWLT